MITLTLNSKHVSPALAIGGLMQLGRVLYQTKCYLITDPNQSFLLYLYHTISTFNDPEKEAL